MSDEQENNEEKTNSIDAFGFDIVYDAKQNAYILKQAGKPATLITEQDFNPEYFNDEFLEEKLDKFSETIQTENVSIDFATALKEKGALNLMAYSDNTLYIYHYNLPDDKREYCLDLLQQEYGLTPQQAEQTLNLYTSEDTAMRMSQIEHELTHFEDDKKYGNQQYDLPPKYMAKLNMLTEIKANMVQASFALDMYEATGDLKYFNTLSIDTSALQAALKENPNMENRKKFVAKYVYNKWLETYNKNDTKYSDQAYLFSTPKIHNYPLWALEDNPQTRARYNERVDAMFENIFGLGDVRDIVNPDFELNEQLKKYLEDENILSNKYLRAIMTKDAHNASEYSRNLLEFLGIVKEIDADGIRTPEEQKRLSQYIKEATQKAQKNSTTDTAKNGLLLGQQQKTRG
ncbi:MAG: hypothetical protein IJ738_01675 [Alphaproteobacteria bacterium]|nr:hypothetical protein [Alphaproteobacteria bacterium]